jgi:hypothetical protein
LSKKIDDKARPFEFSRIRDLVFKEAGVNYDVTNPIQYETYRKALDRFGLIDSFRNFKYPETVLKYDLKKEEGVTYLMKEVAAEYTDLIKSYTDDPKGIIPDLWPLFRVDYNPKFEAFADEKLAIADITLAQIDDILKTADGDDEESRDAAKGTGLETSVPNPIILAETLRRHINLKYVESLGYKVDGIKDDASLSRYLRFNLADDDSDKEEAKPAESSSSPINQSTKETASIKTGQASSNINLTKGAEPRGAENTTEGVATVTEGKPEIVKPEAAPLPATNINLNLEKGPDSPGPGASSNVSSQSVINTTNISTSLPSLEPAAASITQQTLDLSKNTTGPSSTINSQSVSQPMQTTGDTVSSASNSTVINEGPAPSANTLVENTTINQTSVEKDKKKPGFFKNALSKAGALLSPLLENTSESNRGISEMVKAKLNKVLPINSVNNVVNNDKKETNSANQLNLTESSTQIENNKTSVAAGDSTNTAVSTTTTQPIIDATIEKINPTVEGNATTATPDAKPEIPAPVIPPTQSPTLTEIKEPSPAAAEKSPNQPSQPQRSSNPDFSSLEKRLKRIEIALTNPLEVIIKEH